MINIWRLTKLQLLSTFGLNKALHTKDARERRKGLFVSTAIAIGVLLIAVFSFMYSYGMAVAFEQMGRMDLLLAIMMAVTSLVGFFTTVYKAGGVLFSYKDYDLLMSLPVKSSHVVASRVLQLYVLNLFFTSMVMLPAGAVYALKVQPEVYYYLLFLPALLCIPFIPIIAATVIGALISWISSRFRASKMINLVLTLAFVVALIVGSFTLQGNEQELADLENMGAGLADMIYKLYPLAEMYVDAVSAYRIDAFILFTLLSVLTFAVFCTVLGTRYKAIYTGLSTSRTSGKYTMQPLKASTAFQALYRKELRRYFSSSNYVLNTGVGMILLLVMSVSLLFISPEQLGEAAEIPQLSNYLSTLAPIVVSLFVALSCTTSSSISLEGNNLWILKSAPVPKHIILFSKVAVNLTITIPITVVSCLILMISLDIGWLDRLLLLLIPVIYALFTALMGVIVNLKLPKLEWTNEVQVVKQSAAVLVAMILGFISLLIPAGLSLLLSEVDGKVIMLGVAVIMTGICAGMYRYVKTKGEVLFLGL
ncbi:hypothetical protein C2I18_03295 [Paenibacillus sp. PK3_47]|uniref:putative ABC transporter permease subunit n=1 Tax=Paenibacillus sp. PK3_47 TaxID=2072642 RepID=UPI00201DF233|nr:hypothetical protein [Paenibacillus sp. PK3_47]UQZ32668.1 hypothetical protein C2I18_03295 [Paenibacillus sp. PK3_47]